MTLKLRILRSLTRLFIILVSLTMSLFSEKTLISNRCISGLMPNLIKKSWTVSKPDNNPKHEGVKEKSLIIYQISMTIFLRIFSGTMLKIGDFRIFALDIYIFHFPASVVRARNTGSPDLLFYIQFWQTEICMLNLVLELWGLNIFQW